MAALVIVACGGSDDPENPDVNPSQTNVNRNNTAQNAVYGRMEFPRLKGGPNNIVIIHTVPEFGVNYCVEWDPDMQSQRWSCYQMYSSINYHSSYNVSRYYADNDGTLNPECQYPNDPDLPPQYRFATDPFKYSGYDHGHICPSADRLRSNEANYQTFFITNMQPQRNKFNAGLWEKMENQVRTWASNCDTLYVCKGGTIDMSENILGYIGSGSNRIPVPKYFFMAVLSRSGNSYKAAGFWVEHLNEDRSNDNLGNYVVNIYELQKLTNIDFFCNLPDDLESTVESQPIVKKDWGLN